MNSNIRIEKVTKGFAAITDNCKGFGKSPEEACEVITTVFNNYNQWFTKEYISIDSPIIIFGCGRSGTTLLRVMLDSHKNIACGPESELLLFNKRRFIHPDTSNFRNNQIETYQLCKTFSFSAEEFWRIYQNSLCYAHLVENFFRSYSAKMGKKRWAEKTPKNVINLEQITNYFPKAKLIHMIRDGRDVFCSLKTHPKYVWENGRLIHNKLCIDSNKCIQRWLNDTKAGLEWRDSGNYLEIRYEDLIHSAEDTLRTVLDFVDEPWDENALKYYENKNQSHSLEYNASSPDVTKPIHSSARGRWETDMPAEDKELFKQQAGDLLIKLGYVQDNNW